MCALKISPNELVFKFELRKAVPTTLTLKNTSDSKKVGFKVKTTTPKSYAVKPNTGIVPANGSVDVQIIMQAQREMPDFNNVKDKFLVQSCEIQAGEELSSEMFQKAKGREVQETKLQVRYMQPPAPPSPVPEETSDSRMTGQSPRQTGVSNAGGATDSSDQRPGAGRVSVKDDMAYKPVNEQMRRERDAALMKLKNLEAELASVKSNQTAMMNKAGVAGFTLIHLLLTSIICFLLGRYT